MAINYNEESLKRLKAIYAGDLKERELVIGFATWKYDCGAYYEMLYIHTAEGELFETGPHIKSACFDAPNRVWKKCECIPSKAEFIGTYARPLGSKAQAES